jgi:hypothetical protein
MSEENVICSHELLVRFDQLVGNRVIWNITVDDEIWDTQALSLIDLAERGAPLSAMGIRALWKLLLDGLLYNSLEQANGVKTAVDQRLLDGGVSRQSLELVPEDATIN